MRSLLALDTADRTAGVGLVVDGEVVADYQEASVSRPSERLFRLIDEVLRGAHLDRRELSAVAATRGPGSFTGLRVGLSTAKGVAFALGIPAIGVPTLEALAREAMPFPGLVLSLLDARKRQVYAAAFDGRTGEERIPSGARSAEEFARTVAVAGEPALALGSGLAAYESELRASLGASLSCVPRHRWTLRAGTVGLLAWERLERGEVSSAADLTPIYLRRSEAEEGRAPRAGGS